MPRIADPSDTTATVLCFSVSSKTRSGAAAISCVPSLVRSLRITRKPSGDMFSKSRRIVCSTHAGATLELGETYGLIRFGSRLDTYFPADANVIVELGQRAIGGETPLAELA